MLRPLPAAATPAHQKATRDPQDTTQQTHVSSSTTGDKSREEGKIEEKTAEEPCSNERGRGRSRRCLESDKPP